MPDARRSLAKLQKWPRVEKLVEKFVQRLEIAKTAWLAEKQAEAAQPG